MSRPTDFVIQQRRDEVAELLIGGKPSRYITSYIKEKHGVSTKTVERDITIIYKEIKKHTQRNLEDVLSIHVQRYENVYEKAIEAYDFRAAIQALQSIEKLLKMHADQPLVAIQHNTLALDGMSTGQIMDAIKTLKETNKKDDNGDND